jgi:prephenate dehydrogenase
MAGLPEGGVEYASADLFVKRRWILCPENSAPSSLMRVEGLVRKVGAEPVSMTAADHDKAVALTSHVPQVLASVLRATATELGADVAAGPGFASATRVAGGSPEIWDDIFESNADEVSWALLRVIDELQIIAEELGGSPANTAAVMQLLGRARVAREK